MTQFAVLGSGKGQNHMVEREQFDKKTTGMMVQLRSWLFLSIVSCT